MLGPVANRAQFNRVQEMIEHGIAEGAKLVCGGWAGRRTRPRLLCAADDLLGGATEMRIAQEEIFGPVLCMIPIDSVDEAVDIANDTVYGLPRHVQGGDLAAARAVARAIRAGQVHINHPAGIPRLRSAATSDRATVASTGDGLEEYLETKAILGIRIDPAASAVCLQISVKSSRKRGAIMTVALVLHRADGVPVSTSFRRAAFGKADPFARASRIAWEGPDSMIGAGPASSVKSRSQASLTSKPSSWWKAS